MEDFGPPSLFFKELQMNKYPIGTRQNIDNEFDHVMRNLTEESPPSPNVRIALEKLSYLRSTVRGKLKQLEDAQKKIAQMQKDINASLQHVQNALDKLEVG